MIRNSNTKAAFLKSGFVGLPDELELDTMACWISASQGSLNTVGGDSSPFATDDALNPIL